MNKMSAVQPQPSPASTVPLPRVTALPKTYLWALALLVLAFAWPLYDLFRFSLGSELFSYIFLIPVVSVYLAWPNRSQAPDPKSVNRGLAVGIFGLGLALMASYLVVRHSGSEPLAQEDALAWKTASFVVCVFGLSALLLGRRTLATHLFPLGLLLFMIPMPVFFSEAVEKFLQHGSATTAAAFFRISGTTYFRQDTFFQLPGFALNVAPECSGIRSSVALFITSVVAGYIFLRSPWKRTILAFAVIPLALLRNGFRVFTIGELCVHVGPHMIDSPIHHQGGPIFFALSLIPFGLLLVLLVRSERARPAPSAK